MQYTIQEFKKKKCKYKTDIASETLLPNERTLYRSPQTLKFCLHDIFKKAKFTDAENKLFEAGLWNRINYKQAQRDLMQML